MSIGRYSHIASRFVVACLGLVASTCFADMSTPRITWAFQTEGPIRGSAVIASDKIFFGSSDGNVYAVDKMTGALKWKLQTGGAIAGAPAVAGSTIVVSGRSSMVYALDATTGAVRWGHQVQSKARESLEWTYFTASPVVDGDQVLVASHDGSLYALDLASGKLRWRFETQDGLYAAPLVADDVIYQPSGDDHLYALDRSAGKLMWKFATEGVKYDLSQGYTRSDIFTQPMLQDGVLVFGSRDANVYAIDVDQRALKWKFAYDSTWAMSTAVHEGTVFVGWSTNNKINALDLASGSQRWDFDAKAHTYTKALPIGEHVYIASANGIVHKLSARDGSLAWKYAVDSDIYSSLVHDAGVLYVGTDDGRMLALTQSEGTLRKAVYQPANIPEGIRGFLVDEAISPYLVERGYTLLESSQALTQWLTEQASGAAPSVVVFAFAQIPRAAMGSDPASGPLRKYLESGGKVVWSWGMPNKYEFAEDGAFVANDPSVAARLLDVEFVPFEDSGNYFSRPTQSGRNWGMPVWLKTSFASLKSTSGVTVLATDELGRPTSFLKTFHPRIGSGWVNFGPTGYGVPIRPEELATLERIASYAVE